MASNYMYSSILSGRAEKEIGEAWEWYEERQTGLGDRYLKEVVIRIKEIEQSPERYPIRYKSFRETLIKAFPYLIVYKLNKRKKNIQIISIFHTSRNPRKKK